MKKNPKMPGDREKPRRLTLHRETIQKLDTLELDLVRGGNDTVLPLLTTSGTAGC